MLIYSIQRQWVPIVVVFYCSHEVADSFRYDTPFIRAGGSTKGESKVHSSVQAQALGFALSLLLQFCCEGGDVDILT